MKKILLCLCILALCACFVLSGCNEESPAPTPDPDPAPVTPTPEPGPADPDPAPVDPDPDPDPVDPDPAPAEKTITGITLSDKSVTYTGSAQSLPLTGTLPAGVTAAYTYNGENVPGATDVGTYAVRVTLSGKNYVSLELTATLTITPAAITGVTLPDKSVTYTGSAQSLPLAGTLPAGVTAAYTYNGENVPGATDTGTYAVRVTLSGKNYVSLELTATLTITPAAITGVTLPDKSVTYTGSAQSLPLAGTLPAGVTAAYTYNGASASGATDTGTYAVRVTLSGKNYVSLELTATLTITPAEIPLDGVAFEGCAYNYKEGVTRSLAVTGTLPAGVTVTYTYNGRAIAGVTEEGEYTVVATLSGKNYVSTTLTAKLLIKKAASVENIAKTVTDSFGKAPDPWAFLPEGMALSNHVYNGAAPDYAAGASVSALPRMGIGKQLQVLYAPLSESQSALSYVNTLYGGLSVIAGLYQDYINKNPDNYAVFEGTWNVFAFRIEVTEEEYVLLAKAGVVHIELHHETASKETYGRVDIADKLALKYEADEDRLNLAFQVANVRTTQIEFIRKDGVVTGYLYVTTGVGKNRLTTSAILTVTEDYTIAVGNSGDLIVPGQGVNVEVYSSKTGRLLGTEVYENVEYLGIGAEYDTLWFNLWDIEGIDTIATTFAENEKKNNVILYVNGATVAFKPNYNKLLISETSRQYDIEFKTLYYYAYDAETGEYTQFSMEIPMLFVQRPNLSTYLADMKKNNGWSFTPKNTTTEADNAVIAEAYATYKDAYLAMKEKISYEATLAYIGTANPWFSKEDPEEA